ncbi:Predicted dehydrogenase [Butyrivibrio sp. Su6]|uniref:Gfo/Idh/MocA family protein n=1 Tax=Butyrivibrio sp. Su6 TaxID=1520810 RepID=UPI00089E901A|nr:Gfo/Idh/MocA family oxidoreductase [Butyrivibrio sp. Su6]SEG01807.1 Predicted dehydrogenase [Butyrivibrio sp. Su6]
MINVAIVGTGNISNLHVQGLLEFPERCKIVALCDIYPNKAESIKEKYNLGSDVRVFADHKSMLASDVKIDLVHVCTPPYVHASISIDCMNAGKNVLVEKPMAASLEECDRMLEAEKKNNVTLGVIAQNRFRDGVYKLKQLAKSGLAGKICLARVDSQWWRAHCYYDLWWRGIWEKEGGGPTLNHAVHHIDMLNWIEERSPVEATAVLTNVMHDNAEVEDLSLACLKYEDGSVAEVISSVVSHGEEQGITLQCADAKISMPWSLKAEVGMENGFPVDGGNTELIEKINKFYDELPDLKYEGHTGEIDDYLSALENGRKPLITGEDGKRTIEVITAIYEAGFEKKTISLPIAENSEYYKADGIQKNAVHFYEKKSFVENFTEEKITVGNY